MIVPPVIVWAVLELSKDLSYLHCSVTCHLHDIVLKKLSLPRLYQVHVELYIPWT